MCLDLSHLILVCVLENSLLLKSQHLPFPILPELRLFRICLHPKNMIHSLILQHWIEFVLAFVPLYPSCYYSFRIYPHTPQLQLIRLLGLNSHLLSGPTFCCPLSVCLRWPCSASCWYTEPLGFSHQSSGSITYLCSLCVLPSLRTTT